MVIELRDDVLAPIEVKHPYAIVAITKHGVEISRKLHAALPNTDVYYMSKFERGDERAHNVQLFSGSVRMLFPALFKHYQGIITIISLGAVVRMIAPVLVDKKVDPAVVVIDDRGENVISMLSGHLGGANALTHTVAEALQANAIITTASDVQKTIPVDLFGAKFGWQWDSDTHLTPVSASVVNEEHVAIVQETGEKDWWMHDTPMPTNLKQYNTIAEAMDAKPQAALVITHRLLQPDELIENAVVYRPKSLVIGMGCNRGTSTEEVEQVIQETLQELGLSIKSVKALVTFELKKDEPCFHEVTSKYDWEFKWYSKDELNAEQVTAPSDTVFKYTGVYGVSEPAVRRYSGNSELLLVKKKSGNTTISVAEIVYEDVRE